MIFAIAAVSLNLILGYGGMVSLRPRRLPRHRRLRGRHPRPSTASTTASLQWRARDRRARRWSRSSIGAVSLRTSGVYFIMITLAFAQMLYYLGISLEEYGGDDGMRLAARSQFGGLVDLAQPDAVLLRRARDPRRVPATSCTALVNSRFGMVIRAAQVERGAHARDRLLALPLQARRVRHRRRDVRPRRRAARQPDRVPHAGVHALDALGRDHGHGDPRRHGHARRAGARRGRAAAARGRARRRGPRTGRSILGPILVLVVLFARRGLAGLLPGGGRDD